MTFKRTIEIYAGYDRRPAAGGIHGAELVFALQGKHGAVTLAVQTNWIPKAAADEQNRKNPSRVVETGIEPKPLDYTFHFERPLFQAQQLQHTVCPYMPEGTECYSMRDSKLSSELRDVLLREGSVGVWKHLINEYNRAVRMMGNPQELEN
jgi:hypothetical protein